MAKFYLAQNKPKRSDYAQKYEKLLQDINKQTPMSQRTFAEKNSSNNTDATIKNPILSLLPVTPNSQFKT